VRFAAVLMRRAAIDDTKTRAGFVGAGERGTARPTSIKLLRRGQCRRARRSAKRAVQEPSAGCDRAPAQRLAQRHRGDGDVVTHRGGRTGRRAPNAAADFLESGLGRRLRIETPRRARPIPRGARGCRDVTSVVRMREPSRNSSGIELARPSPRSRASRRQRGEQRSPDRCRIDACAIFEIIERFQD